MARRIVWTSAAWRDLEHIADFISQDSPSYAAAFVERIRRQAHSLDELAYRGRVVPELGEESVRELLLGNYRLLYEIREEAVYILGLIHGARDLAALWERERRLESE